MSDWESPPTKVNNNNIKAFMDLNADGYAGGGDFENPATNLKLIDAELARKDLHPVARKALLEERATVSTKADKGWETPPTGTPSAAGPASADAGWESPTTAGAAVPFKSGEAFKDTKDLMPDVGGFIDTFKKQWANRANTPMTKADITKMVADEHAAGSGILDTVAALPAMVAGGVHGIWDGISKGDATAGLQTAGKTMQKFLPSTILGNEKDQQMGGYHAAMAPVTAAMDTMNAVPTGFGEMLNAAGMPEAAAQVEAAGKLGIMTVLGAKGTKEAYKAITGREAPSAEAAASQLEQLRAAIEAEKAKKTATKQNGAADRGVAPTAEKPQGELFSPDHPADAPTAPIPGDAQMGLFDKPAEPLETIPYEQSLGDIGQNHPGLTLDQLKQRQDTSGPQPANPGMVAPRTPDMEAIHPDNLSLVPKDEGPLPEIPTLTDKLAGPDGIPVLTDRLAPPDGIPVLTDRVHDPIREQNMQGHPATDTMRKALEQAQRTAEEKRAADAAVQAKRAQAEPAYAELERQKQADYAHMEAQRELDFAKAVEDINERSTMRQAFLDRANLDFQHLTDKVKDASMMPLDRTIEMRAHLRRGDVQSALKALMDNHPIKSYRDLAKYLMDKVEGLQVKMHDESVIRMGDREITGYYDPQNHMVGLSGLGASSPHTVLHELTHAVTSHFINTNPKDMRVTGLKALFKAMVNERGMKDFPGIMNVKEFVAEAFSNPKFQEFLKGARMNNKSIWRRFVDNVKSIVGIDNQADMVNAFEHAMDLGKQVIEAQTGKAEVREQLKNGGLTNRLADLMAQAPRDTRPELGPNNARLEAINRMSGAAQALKDYIPENFTIDQLREAARQEPDVQQNILQKGINQFTSGGLYQSLKTKNIIVKKTYESIGAASDKAQSLINQFVKDKDTGVLTAARRLTKEESASAVAVRMIMDAEQMELSGHKLAEMGMSENQIAWITKARNTNDAAFKSVNESRVAAGLKPIDRRLGYAVSRTLGDFRKMVMEDVIKADGTVERKVVGQIAASTRMELNRIEKMLADKKPDYIIGEEKYMGQGAHKDTTGSRQSAYREALQTIADGDPRAENFMKVLADTFVGDAYDYMNAKRHTLAKKGIFGAEGREAWKSAHENAVNFMKAEVTYAETMFRWGELSKAVKEITPLLSDETIHQPNAKAWADAYIDQAMGINPTKIGKALNDFIGAVGDVSGVGSKNINNFGTELKGITNTVLLGLNPLYMAINMIQPLQGMPVIKALLNSRGLETRFDAGTGYSYLVQGLMSTLKDRTDGKLGGRMSEFETQMAKYGKDHQIFGNEILDHSSQVQNNLSYKAAKVTDFGINAIESNTNRLVFSGISHLLNESGMKVSEGLFETAFKLTKEVMHDYRPIEAPMGFQNFGSMGNLAKNLTKYKTGEMSKLAAMVREIPDNGSWTPLMATIASQVAFAGMLGVTGVHEADQLFQYITKKMGKPMTLAGLIMKFPELASHGIGSLVGLDLTARLGMSDILPNSLGQAAFGGVSKIADIASAGGQAILHPSEMNTKRLVREASPGIATGMMDRKWFSTTNTKGEEMSVTRKPSDFHNIEGGTPRNDADKFWKTIGGTGVHESRDKAMAYDRSVIANNYKELRKGVITQLADDIFTNNGKLDPQALKKARDKYIKYEGDPNTFASEIQHEMTAQKTDAITREKLRNATGNVTGARNLQRMFGK